MSKKQLKEYKKIINKYALDIVLLKESRKTEIKEYSTQWQILYSKMKEYIYVWLDMDIYFYEKFGRDIKDILQDKQIENVIFRDICYFCEDKMTENGFVGYLAKSINRETRRYLESKKGRVNTLLSYDENLKISDENSWQQKESDPALIYENKNKTKTLNIVLDLIQEKYESTVAGQPLKKQVYTFFILEEFRALTEIEINNYCEKYCFINKDAVLFYLVKNNIKPTQKEFAKYTKTSTNKYSIHRKELCNFLQKRIKREFENIIL